MSSNNTDGHFCCTFCGKDRNDVELLLSDKNGKICNRCFEIFAGQVTSKVKETADLTRIMDAYHLNFDRYRIYKILEEIEQIDHSELKEVCFDVAVILRLLKAKQELKLDLEPPDMIA
jgi:ATP-dependent protease Clp ATPase subunit